MPPPSTGHSAAALSASCTVELVSSKRHVIVAAAFGVGAAIRQKRIACHASPGYSAPVRTGTWAAGRTSVSSLSYFFARCATTSHKNFLCSLERLNLSAEACVRSRPGGEGARAERT